MPIHPLPQFEADLEEHQIEQDRLAYERLQAPKTMVVRYGFMKMIGEFPYDGDAKPGCGSKIVVQTFRGTEIGEMLTSTCPNAGCSKSVTRKEMLEYIENSGGRDYPFTQTGKALRVATTEDMNTQARLEQSKHGLKMDARARAERLGLALKIVEAEPILGEERLTFFYASEDRVDLRALIEELSEAHRCRIEMRQVGARDEARLTADYERCGQYCCCKNFLKVLKPISMRSAKTQKATLDPLKISGRCGRLMCCLRYEDETYETLRKRLPKRKKKVGTPDGDGIVIDAQILTQLVLVELDGVRRRVAFPVEEITAPTGKIAEPDRPAFGRSRDRGPERSERPERPDRPDRSGRRSDRPGRDAQRTGVGTGAGADAPTDQAVTETGAPPQQRPDTGDAPKKKKRRRKRKTGQGQGQGQSQGQPQDRSQGQSNQNDNRGQAPQGDRPQGAEGGSKKKRRRRRRKKSGGEGGSPGGGGSSGGD